MNFTELIQENGLTLVDFFATWCGPCKMMHPILEELKETMGDKLRIIKLDIDKEANKQLCLDYQIQSVPTLMLFKAGKNIWRTSGAMPLSQLTDIVKSNL